MKTTIIKLSIVLFLATISTSCNIDMLNRVEGDRNVISEKRQVNEDFSKVKVSSGIDLYIKQGSKTSLTVEADENLHDIIIIEVVGGKLKIYTEKNIWIAKAKKVYLTVTSLEELTATSGSDVISENTLKVNDFEVSTSSGADLRIEVEANYVVSSSSSGSDLRISGTANTHETSASSGSSIKAYSLESKKVTARVSSGADIGVFASESLNAKASSGGDIRYKGNPKSVDKKTSSGGGISAR